MNVKDMLATASEPAIVAVWTALGSGYGDSGPLVTAVSKNAGKTWQPGGNPADDGSTAGHAYTEILAGPQARSCRDDKALHVVRFRTTSSVYRSATSRISCCVRLLMGCGSSMNG